MSAGLLFPADAGCDDPAVVGGKAANLAQLVRLGAPVPDFFVVPAAVSRHSGGRLDEGLRAQLAAALERLGDDPLVAVRSSAVGEDSAGASFAGVFDTVLDVRGAEAVVAAIERCWESLHGEAAGGYSAHAEVGDAGMAVVVQVMAPAAWSGVSFTADPALLALSRVVVDGSRAGAEAVVSGEVTPARAVLAAVDGALLEAQAEAGGGTMPAAVHGAVWRESMRIAAELGFPQDLEWAAEDDGTLWILQSRPITTLGAVFANRSLESWASEPGDVDEPGRIWTRAYGDEVWTAPVSPLFYTLHDQAPHFRQHYEWFSAAAELPAALQKYHRAAAYFDVGMLAGFYEFVPRVARVDSILAFFPAAERERLRAAPWRWRGWLRRTRVFELSERRRFSLRNNDRALVAQWPEYDRHCERWSRTDVESMDAEAAWDHSREVVKLSTPMMELSMVMISHAFDVKCLLVGLLEAWVGDGDANYAAATVGLQGASTVSEAEALWELGAEIRGCEPLAALVAGGAGWPEFRAAAEAERPELVARFEEFVHGHRHRGATYKDVVYPRWGDDPALAFGVLRGYVGGTTPRPSSANAERAADRELAQRRILAAAGGPLGFAKRALLRTLFHYNARYQHLRDDYRFRFDHIWFECRRVYRRIGAILAERGLLADPGDVFFLGHRELRAATKGELDAAALAARIEVRRGEWEETRAALPPKFLRAYAAAEDEELAGAPGAALSGIAASPGVARGRARVIHDAEELEGVADGEIVVTRRTDPGWTAAFPRLGGLVLETGGVLSHGASLCREFDLPCVTAVEAATSRIADGSEIEVLGSAGQVRILAGDREGVA